MSGFCMDKVKNAVLTGASKGIGKKILEKLALEKINVGCLCRTWSEEFSEYIEKLENKLRNLKPTTKMIKEGYSAIDIINEITDGDYELLETKELKYECNCSKDKFRKGLKSLGKEQIETILNEDKKAEIVCNFCNKKYVFSEDDLKEILFEL